MKTEEVVYYRDIFLTQDEKNYFYPIIVTPENVDTVVAELQSIEEYEKDCTTKYVTFSPYIILNVKSANLDSLVKIHNKITSILRVPITVSPYTILLDWQDQHRKETTRLRTENLIRGSILGFIFAMVLRAFGLF